LGERISIHVDTAQATWSIWVDAHQLENAILNLAVNARDAMDGAGRLDIIVTDRSIGDAERSDIPPGDYVCISVRDNGCGMSEDVLKRAFEPFFTTKPVGKGTGLGLSQIFAFARQSGGEVRIESIVGQGTTISLFLPRYAAAPAERAVGDPAQEAQSRHGPLSILLVEDDPRVHASTRAALSELGHEVRGCTSAAEALALLGEGATFDLLLTDVMMPGMTGTELVAKASRDYPHIAVLFVTGYVGEAGQSDDFAGHEVLRKPFTITALGAAVSNAMDRRGGAAAS